MTHDTIAARSSGEVSRRLLVVCALITMCAGTGGAEPGTGQGRTRSADPSIVLDASATILIGAHDPRAPEAALDAARRLMALHKLHAASDVLLDFIGAGFVEREAQRLLIEVNCELGRRETAREKCHLLGTAYRLDGQGAVAEDVERLARIL